MKNVNNENIIIETRELREDSKCKLKNEIWEMNLINIEGYKIKILVTVYFKDCSYYTKYGLFQLYCYKNYLSISLR